MIRQALALILSGLCVAAFTAHFGPFPWYVGGSLGMVTYAIFFSAVR